MARGRTPRRYRRPRTEDLPELLERVRRSHLHVLTARGHLLAHQGAEDDAVRAAFAAGATHRELVEATGQRWAPGKIAPTFRRNRR